MVFSFFKKPPEKMISRPAAVPRQDAEARAKTPDGGERNSVPGTSNPPAAGSNGPSSQPVPSAFSDFVFSETTPGFQIEGELDPVDAAAEEAAVLFANGQDEAVRVVLEGAVKELKTANAERLWWMLFDFYRLAGQRAPFEALGIEYARAFEKSPPGWAGRPEAPQKATKSTTGALAFKGDLLGSNTAGFEAVRLSLEKNTALRLDMSKVTQLDAGGCGALLALLQRARASKRAVELLGREALGGLVQGCVETGRAEDKECWLLLLELCQMQGQQDAFEEVAIDYAVTFEESPPSWIPERVAQPEPEASIAAGVEMPETEAYQLQGDIKSSRFGDLPAYAEGHDPVLVDCEKLTRMDFISAGALLNALSKVRRTGKQIVFRHPHYLVAELFGVVGLKAVATIVFAKH